MPAGSLILERAKCSPYLVPAQSGPQFVRGTIQNREEAWVQHHDEVANSTLLMSVDSWYNGANIEGKPRRLLSYIGGVGAYRDLCDEIRTNGYPGFAVA